MKNFLRILSTKKLQPELIALAEKENILVETIPFIEIHRRMDMALQNRIQELSQKQITAVFTSQYAVSAVFSVIEKPKCWKIFCISGKTKSTLLNWISEEQIVDVAPDGRALAEKMIHDQPESSLVFFCGNKRMPTIPKALKEAGIDFEEVVVYDNIENPVKLNRAFNGILFFSPSAVDSFFSVNKINQQTILFSVGTTTEDALKQHTNNTIVTALFPSEGEVIRNVIKYKSPF